MSKYLSKVMERAQPFLEPGETVRAAVWGQTGVPPGFLGGFMLLFGLAKSRVVATTDRNLYVFQGSVSGTAKIKGVVAKHQLGAAAVEFAGTQLTVAGQPKMWVNPYQTGRAKELTELAMLPA